MRFSLKVSSVHRALFNVLGWGIIFHAVVLIFRGSK